MPETENKDTSSGSRARPTYRSVLGVWRFALVLFGGAAIGTFGFWLLADMWLNHPASSGFWDTHGLFPPSGGDALDETEAVWVESLLRQGKIISPENIMAQTMAFYDILIVVLVTVLALMGGLSYMYIRGASLAHAEECAEQATRRETGVYFSSQGFHAEVREFVEERLKGGVTEL